MLTHVFFKGEKINITDFIIINGEKRFQHES